MKKYYLFGFLFIMVACFVFSEGGAEVGRTILENALESQGNSSTSSNSSNMQSSNLYSFLADSEFRWEGSEDYRIRFWAQTIHSFFWEGNITNPIKCTVSGNNLSLEFFDHLFQSKQWVWTIIDSNTLRDQTGDLWKRYR